MPVVRHIKGGSIGFRSGGASITVSKGWMGEIPVRIYDQYKGRFELIDDQIPRETADMKKGQALTREQEPGKLSKYLARHRGRGGWAVTETETGKMVSEIMPRDQAEAKARGMNGEKPAEENPDA